MPLAFNKIVATLTCLLVILGASAQADTHFISGSFSEKTLAELHLMQVVNGKSRVFAGYQVSPGDGNFVFAIPASPKASYRLQVNLLKPGARKAKLLKIVARPLSILPGNNYTLNITPSKLSDTHKGGWDLKQDVARTSNALITGKILNAGVKTAIQMSLQNVVNGEMVSRNSFYTDSDLNFELPAQVNEEGFYYITTPRCSARVYLKPADRLQVNLDHKTGKFILIKGSMENQLLSQWQQLISPITEYGYNMSFFNPDSINLDAYIKTYEKLQPAMAEFSNNLDMTNHRFLKSLTAATEIDRELVPINLLFHLSVKNSKGFRPSPKDFNEVPAFYKRFIQPAKFTDASILLLGEARQFMNLYAKLNLAALPKEDKEALSQNAKLKLMLNTVSNDTLKSLLFNDQMQQMEVNNLSEFKETFEPFRKYATAMPAKETYESIYGLFSSDTAYIGKSSYNFTLPDTTGRMVSMKDFKGKVVFIDVWATWCGPCKAQFPFMKEIEHEYAANKDLVFVGISVDKAEVKEKWLDMIRKEKLGGVQLMDDAGKEFGRKYEVSAIPRFMLIDKKGNWIEIRCPRPESKQSLKAYLDKALAE